MTKKYIYLIFSRKNLVTNNIKGRRNDLISTLSWSDVISEPSDGCKTLTVYELLTTYELFDGPNR